MNQSRFPKSPIKTPVGSHSEKTTDHPVVIEAPPLESISAVTTSNTRYHKEIPKSEAISPDKVKVLSDDSTKNDQKRLRSRAEECYYKFDSKFPLTFFLVGIVIIVLAYNIHLINEVVLSHSFLSGLYALGFSFIAITIVGSIVRLFGWNFKRHPGEDLSKAFKQNGNNYEQSCQNFLSGPGSIYNEKSISGCLEKIDHVLVRRIKNESVFASVAIGLSPKKWLANLISFRAYYRLTRMILESYDRKFSSWVFLMVLRNFFFTSFVVEVSGLIRDVSKDLITTCLGNVAGQMAGVGSGFVNGYINYKLLLSFSLYCIFISRPIPFNYSEEQTFLLTFEFDQTDLSAVLSNADNKGVAYG